MSSRLAALVERFPAQTILVVGDLIADEFVYGEIARVSREAPVLILHYERTETMPGGAGNTASNLAALGVRTRLFGVVGRDRAGRMLTLALRDRGIDTGGVMSLMPMLTPTKTRILAGSAHAPRQQVIRIDREEPKPPDEATVERLAKKIQARLSEATGVILSDYAYGVVHPRILGLLRNECRTRRIPIVADSRHRLRDFTGLTSATPNEAEAEELAGRRFNGLDHVFSEAETLRARLDLEALLLTRGPEGVVLVEKGKPAAAVEAVGGKDPVDVTGAGDTVIAVYTTTLAAGGNFEEAARLANYAAGCVVMKRGTATVGPEELLEKLRENGE